MYEALEIEAAELFRPTLDVLAAKDCACAGGKAVPAPDRKNSRSILVTWPLFVIVPDSLTLRAAFSTARASEYRLRAAGVTREPAEPLLPQAARPSMVPLARITIKDRIRI